MSLEPQSRLLPDPRRPSGDMFQRQMKFWLIAFALIVLVLWLLSEILLPFIMGLAIAYLLTPFVDRLERAGANRLAASLLIISIVVLLFVLVILLVAPVLGGQLASFIDTEFLPPEYAELYQEQLSRLRTSAPPMPWERVERVLEEEYDEPASEHFSDFEQEAFAAASIGQVHRATLNDGRAVAVKIQYPGVAEALESDMRNAGMLVRLARALAPGLDAKAVAKELREHVAKTLGPIAKPRQILLVAELPKTRSGKIMRRLLRDVAENRSLGDVTTLQDSSVMDLISAGLRSGASQED